MSLGASATVGGLCHAAEAPGQSGGGDRLDYQNALSTLAEIAIAITGFAGVVAVFGRRSSGHWSVIEQARLVVLLGSSLAALLFCVLPFVVLSIPVSESSCWRSLSVLLAVALTVFTAQVVRVNIEALRVPRSEREVSLLLSAIFLTGDLLAIILLLANAFLGVVWPYLAAIIWVLARAAMIFVRMVMIPVGRGSAG